MTTVIVVALITLCICSMLIVALFAVIVYSLFSRSAPSPLSECSFEPATPKPEISPEEMESARRRFNDELEAFQEMMSYNANVAYGIEPKE